MFFDLVFKKSFFYTRIFKKLKSGVCLLVIGVLVVKFTSDCWAEKTNGGFFVGVRQQLEDTAGRLSLNETSKLAANGVLLFNDSNLINYVRERLLIFPDWKSSRQLRSESSKFYGQHKQDQFIDQLLNQRRNGFFIEAGAYDGESGSNTLFFEKDRNWTGLLIEANPSLFQRLREKKRKAYLSPTCISITMSSVATTFAFDDFLGGIESVIYKKNRTNIGMVQCIPLMTYLLALGVYHIDYFSLDVEGGEVEVLKTIDFRLFQIDTLSIEYYSLPESREASLKRLNNIRKVMLETQLYKEVTTIADLDIVFIRNETKK